MGKKTGNNGIKLIKSFEGCKLTAYRNSGERYLTIGWGHYGPDVKAGQTLTQSEADALFVKDLPDYEKYVNNSNYVTITKQLTQNQFDALVSFCYNCGPGNLKKLCAGKTAEQISGGFEEYVHSNGEVLSGLVRRRKAEKALFNSNKPNSASTASTTFSDFIAEAEKHIGEGGSWTWTTYGQSGIEWCAAFVSAVAKTVGGMLGVVLASTASAQGLGRQSTNSGYGKYYKGPAQNGKTKPQKGDLIFFRWSSKSRVDKFDCDHVGIVVDVNDSKVTTVEGNSGTNNKNTSKVTKNNYSLTYKCISGYFRPDWSKVGGSSGGTVNTKLYDTQNTREDMSIRQIGYLSKKYEPSIKSSQIKLSVINYTTMLSALYSLVNPVQGKVTYDTTALKGKSKIVVDFFLGKELNGAASCALAGSLYVRSKFQTKFHGDGKYGICKWSGDKAKAMKKHVGSKWATNLSGQLDFLWTDLKNNYSTLASTLVLLGNTKDGARGGADSFATKYLEVKDSTKHKDRAEKYFDDIKIIEPKPISSPTSGDDGLPVRGTVKIPSSVDQNGLTTNYTYYIRNWTKGTTQRTLYDMWVTNGSKEDKTKRLAMLDDYYLVAVAPTFGQPGDVIIVYLDNGEKFKAIIGDAKNPSNSNYTKWGHMLSPTGNIDVIEWESTTPNKNEINLGSWRSRKVTKIANKGRYPEIKRFKEGTLV